MSSPMHSRSGLSIRARTLLGFSLVVILVLVASGIALLHMRSSDRLEQVMRETSREMMAFSALRSSWFELVTLLDQMLLTRQSSIAEEPLVRALSGLREAVDSLRPLSAEEAALYGASVSALAECVESVASVAHSIAESADQGSWARAQITRHTEMASLARQFEERLEELGAAAARRVSGEIRRAEEAQGRSRTWLIVTLAGALVLGPLAAVVTASSLIRPIEYLAASVRSMGPDGLRKSLDVSRTDEIGELARAYNSMTERLGDVLQGLQEQVEAYSNVQNALRRSEARYRNLFQHSPISLWELDLSRLEGVLSGEGEGEGGKIDMALLESIRVTDVNMAALELLGLQGAEGPESLETFLTDHMREVMLKALRTFAAGGSTFSAETELLAGTGEVRNVIAHFAVPPESRGTFSRAFVSLQDITERREMEKALRESELQYYQAQKMEAVGRLTGGVAHDFNNLLTVIINNCDIALSGPDVSESMRKRLFQIRKAATGAASVTEQLLAFSHQQVSNPVPLDLNALVERVTDMLGHVIGEDVELVTSLGEHVPTVTVDPGQMEQVLLNLAVNARDAMPGGGVLTIITSSARISGSDRPGNHGAVQGDYSTVTVSDNGCGMEADVLEKAFEPFFTTKERGKGTGLGLATAHGIVTDGGGWIDVSSVPGEGTTFTVYMPSSGACPVEGETAVAYPEAREGAGTVLLLEDQEEVRDVIASALDLHGYDVLEAGDGAAALELFSSHRDAIDLLVSDVVLPGEMDGIGMARLLRKSRPDLAVLLISGYAQEAIARSGSLPEWLSFMQKPFSMSGFLNRVALLMGSGAGGQAPE